MPAMAYETAKLLLERAATSSEREEAIRRAICLGMPLNEVEKHLDWLDNRRARRPNSVEQRPAEG